MNQSTPPHGTHLAVDINKANRIVSGADKKSIHDIRQYVCGIYTTKPKICQAGLMPIQ